MDGLSSACMGAFTLGATLTLVGALVDINMMSFRIVAISVGAVIVVLSIWGIIYDSKPTGKMRK